MASFKAKFPVLQELFAKNHRGALWAPSGARVKKRGQDRLFSALATCEEHIIRM